MSGSWTRSSRRRSLSEGVVDDEAGSALLGDDAAATFAGADGEPEQEREADRCAPHDGSRDDRRNLHCKAPGRTRHRASAPSGERAARLASGPGGVIRPCHVQRPECHVSEPRRRRLCGRRLRSLARPPSQLPGLDSAPAAILGRPGLRDPATLRHGSRSRGPFIPPRPCARSGRSRGVPPMCSPPDGRRMGATVRIRTDCNTIISSRPS